MAEKGEYFKTTFLNGYQKNEVEEYVDQLKGAFDILEKKLAEQEELAKQLNDRLEETDDLKTNLTIVLEDNKRLTQENTELKETNSRLLEKANELLEKHREQKDSELEKARDEAEKIIQQAQKDGKQIELESKVRALQYQREAEEQTRKRANEEYEKLISAKDQVEKYVTALNASREGLIEYYNELGRLMRTMPVMISDFSAGSIRVDHVKDMTLDLNEDQWFEELFEEEKEKD